MPKVSRIAVSFGVVAFLASCSGADPHACGAGDAGNLPISDGGLCPISMAQCAGQCVMASAASCGPSCQVCSSAPTHAQPICSQGTCQFACDVGYVRSGNECSTAKAVQQNGYTTVVTTVANTWRRYTGQQEFAKFGIADEGPADIPLAGIVSLAIGGEHSCVVMAGGAVKCAGVNSQGQLGDGTIADKTTYVDVLGLSSGFVEVSAAGNASCARSGTGALWCWGALGGDPRITPVQIADLPSGAAQLSGKCARLQDGTVRCISGTGSSPVPGLSQVAQLSGQCAVLTTGAVQCWGTNVSGVLGDGTTTSRNTPMNVLGLNTGYVQVAMSYDHACALSNTGRVVCWGRGDHGEIGDGAMVSRLTPTPLPGTDTFLAISAGGGSACGITVAGVVKCWGAAWYLVDGTFNQPTPTAIRGD